MDNHTSGHGAPGAFPPTTLPIIPGRLPPTDSHPAQWPAQYDSTAPPMSVNYAAPAWADPNAPPPAPMYYNPPHPAPVYANVGPSMPMHTNAPPAAPFYSQASPPPPHYPNIAPAAPQYPNAQSHAPTHANMPPPASQYSVAQYSTPPSQPPHYSNSSPLPMQYTTAQPAALQYSHAQPQPPQYSNPTSPAPQNTGMPLPPSTFHSYPPPPEPQYSNPQVPTTQYSNPIPTTPLSNAPSPAPHSSSPHASVSSTTGVPTRRPVGRKPISKPNATPPTASPNAVQTAAFTPGTTSMPSDGTIPLTGSSSVDHSGSATPLTSAPVAPPVVASPPSGASPLTGLGSIEHGNMNPPWVGMEPFVHGFPVSSTGTNHPHSNLGSRISSVSSSHTDMSNSSAGMVPLDNRYSISSAGTSHPSRIGSLSSNGSIDFGRPNQSAPFSSVPQTSSQIDASGPSACPPGLAPLVSASSISSVSPPNQDYFSLPPLVHTQSATSQSGTVSSATSPASTVYSPVFTPIGPTETGSSVATTVATPLTPPTNQRLGKPIVIPRILCHAADQTTMGLPYHRAYPKILAQHGISQAEFLTFIDELNIQMAGHVGFKYARLAGKVTSAAGGFDPTGITRMVGKSVILGADLGQIAYMKGPLAAKRSALRQANERLFQPRGLRATILSGRQLRKALGLDAKHPLTAPLMTGWTVPGKAELQAGQRAKVRTMGRIIYHLREHVQDLTYCAEANPNWATEPFARRTAAKLVHDQQIVSEVKHEEWRGEALELYAQARAATNAHEKTKLNRKAAAKDKEMAHVKWISWLVVRNLEEGERQRGVEAVQEEELKGLEEDMVTDRKGFAVQLNGSSDSGGTYAGV